MNSTREQRLRYIMEILKERHTVPLLELSDIFSVSTVTIRKDVAELEEKGLVFRQHGSVSLRNDKGIPFFPLDKRSSLQNDEKLRIAAAAAALVTPNDSVILDSGTTAAMVAREMVSLPPISIATNSILAAQELRGSSHNVSISGGNVINQSLCIVGAEAVSFFSNIHATKMFLGATGIRKNFLLTTGLASEAEIKKAMLDAADEVILVADSSKFLRTDNSMFSFCLPERVSCVVTGAEPPEGYRELLFQLNIRLVVAL